MFLKGDTMTEQETITVEELAQAMEERAVFYRFIGNALLHEFTAEQIGQLKELDLPDLEDAEAQEAYRKAKRYLARAGADPRTDLAVDYARVFLSAGVYDGLTAEPYESVFTSEDQLLMQEARDEVVTIYRENGVDIDPELHMPEDHLGLEFEFIAIMADKTAEALRDADTVADEDFSEPARMVHVQADFIENHILNWIDALIEKVDEFAQLPLYPALMRIAKAYTKNDAALLADVNAALV